MNGAEALAPSLGYKANNASHKPRTTKLKQPTEQRTKAKPQHKHIHIHSNHNNHHHHHHDRSKPKSITNHYTNGAGNGYHPQTTVRIASASTSTLTSTEETDAFLSSSLSFTPSPSPSAFHCNLHNTYTHHEADAKERSSYTLNSNALIPLSLIHGFLRSCLDVDGEGDLEEEKDYDVMDDDFDYNYSDIDVTLVIPSGIVQSIMFLSDSDRFDDSEQCGCFVWKLSTLELLTAQCLESRPFQIGSFLWFLSIYPYGIDSEHFNFSNLYINLCSSGAHVLFNSFVSELVVNARLYCVETKSCWSSIKMFGMDVLKHGWQKGALKIDEMCRYKSLTFVVYINVLMIKSLQLINNILYQYPLELCSNKFVIKWKIDSLLLSDLRGAHEMCRFESDICNNMWVLGCVPNGLKKDNEASVFKIYLKLCALPPNISKIKVKFNIICIETKKHIKYIYNDFDYKHKYWQTDKLCKRSYLMFNDFATLRFKAEIEIIEEYDLFSHEVSSNVWANCIENDCVCSQITTYISFLSAYRLKLLIRGTTRTYIGCGANAIVSPIYRLIRAFYPPMNCDLFRWNINLEQVIKLSQLNAKQRFDSAIFTISNLKWFLQIYPNGYRPEDEGFCSVYLILAYLPSILAEITIHFCVYCPQTMSNFSTIHTFNHSRDGRGTRRMLSLAHLKKIKMHANLAHITFNCCINILRIQCKRKKIIYQYPLRLNHINYKHYICTSFEWKIDENMLSKFKQSNNGQRFESDIFNEMWNLSIFPNENKNKKTKTKLTNLTKENEANEANVVIGIRLCALPKNIFSIRVYYKLICVEFQESVLDNSSWTHTAQFDYDNYYVKAPKHTIKAKYINRYRQLTFKAEIRILQLYDANKQPIQY